MGTLNPKIPSDELHQALDQAGQYLKDIGQRLLTPEVLLYTLIQQPESTAHRLLVYLEKSRGVQLDELEKTTATMARMRAGRDVKFEYMDRAGNRIPLSDEMTKVLDSALTIAERRDEVQTNTDHVLLAMAQPGMSTSGVLQRYGLSAAVLEQSMAALTGGRGGTTVDYVALAGTENPPPVYLREKILQELTSLLSLARNRHVLLVGPAGVGKNSLVLGLAKQIAAGKGPNNLKTLIQLSERVLIDDPVKALQAGLKQAAGGILFLPHIHRFFGGRLDAEFYDAGAPLRKALLSNSTAIIGSTDQASFDRLMAKNTTVLENIHLLTVPPATQEETEQILEIHRPELERDYQVEIDPAALKAAAGLAGRYLTTTPLPGAAMRLIHRAAASLQVGRPEKRVRLDPEDVTLTVSQMTGIPVNKLGVEERTRYAQMVEHLHARIIGQDEAVLAVSRAVKTARVGLKDPNRPIGSFLFLGPTGVGKTELAKALAEFMFGDEDAAIEIDMSEYQQEHSLNRLIGAPPGYVGYEGGGQLTDAVREKPYSIVLFDEVEKAHQRVSDILLQVVEEGRLTDGQGRTTRFNETVIILTSNLGSEYLVDPVISEEQRELVNMEVKQHFRPEFLNRLDSIILFHPLSPEQLKLILGLLLNKEKKLADKSGIQLEVSEEAVDWLLAKNDHPEWGARPLRRIIRQYLREPLADAILKSTPKPGTVFHIGVEAGELVFEVGEV